MERTIPAGREPYEPSSRYHVPALDAVRGLAILLVLLLHFSNYGHGLPQARIFVDRLFELVTRACWVGVDLFFVLSGFLITGILYDSKASPHYFRHFYARRVLRIFPLYYATLVVFLLLLPRVLPNNARIQALENDAFWYWTYLLNIRIAYDGWRWFDALGHFWSLAVEEQFYFLWPVVVLVFGRSMLMQICLWCIGGSFVVRAALILMGHSTAAYVLTPARLDALAVGAILALQARSPGGLTRTAPFALPGAGCLGLVLAALFVWRRGLTSQDPVISTIGHTLLACLFGAVIVLALITPRHGFLGRMFASRILAFFGRYSYALYVFHHPILFIEPGFLPLNWVPTVFGSLLLKKMVYIVSATALSVGFALISWHLYEKQFLRLTRFFRDQPVKAGVSPLYSPMAAACSQPPVSESATRAQFAESGPARSVG